MDARCRCVPACFARIAALGHAPALILWFMHRAGGDPHAMVQDTLVAANGIMAHMDQPYDQVAAGSTMVYRGGPTGTAVHHTPVHIADRSTEEISSACCRSRELHIPDDGTACCATVQTCRSAPQHRRFLPIQVHTKARRTTALRLTQSHRVCATSTHLASSAIHLHMRPR